MEYNIHQLISANNDLTDILDILIKFSSNQPVVFLESFYKFRENVSRMPFMFPKYNHNPKYRKAALAFGYLAFYRVNERKKEIVIYRILHSKQNIGDLI